MRVQSRVQLRIPEKHHNDRRQLDATGAMGGVPPRSSHQDPLAARLKTNLESAGTSASAMPFSARSAPTKHDAPPRIANGHAETDPNSKAAKSASCALREAPEEPSALRRKPNQPRAAAYRQINNEAMALAAAKMKCRKRLELVLRHWPEESHFFCRAMIEVGAAAAIAIGDVESTASLLTHLSRRVRAGDCLDI